MYSEVDLLRNDSWDWNYEKEEGKLLKIYWVELQIYKC